MADFDLALKKQHIILPDANPAAANYIPTIQHDDLLYISGQTCRLNGKMEYTGVLGESCTTELGALAAELCAKNLLAQVQHACGGTLNKVKQCIRLGIYVQCTPSFNEQAIVANGASNLIVSVFGEYGKHVRSAIGCSALPGNSTIEIDAIFAINA